MMTLTDQEVPIFDFENQVHYWVNRLGFLLRKEIHLRFKANGIDLRAEEMALLVQLWQNPGQTPSALADKTVRDRTTVTRFLDGLEKKGLVTRKTDPTDRRRVIVQATKKSAGLQPKVLAGIREMIADSLDGVSPEELETTKRVLRQITGTVLEMRN
jgi:DNA-binding MarR family transcriptional regulator